MRNLLNHNRRRRKPNKRPKTMTIPELIKRELDKKPAWWWVLNVVMIAGLTYIVLSFSLAVF